jgi:hypothetical protein
MRATPFRGDASRTQFRAGSLPRTTRPTFCVGRGSVRRTEAWPNLRKHHASEWLRNTPRWSCLDRTAARRDLCSRPLVPLVVSRHPEPIPRSGQHALSPHRPFERGLLALNLLNVIRDRFAMVFGHTGEQAEFPLIGLPFGFQRYAVGRVGHCGILTMPATLFPANAFPLSLSCLVVCVMHNHNSKGDVMHIVPHLEYHKLYALGSKILDREGRTATKTREISEVAESFNKNMERVCRIIENPPFLVAWSVAFQTYAMASFYSIYGTIEPSEEQQNDPVLKEKQQEAMRRYFEMSTTRAAEPPSRVSCPRWASPSSRAVAAGSPARHSGNPVLAASLVGRSPTIRQTSLSSPAPCTCEC